MMILFLFGYVDITEAQGRDGWRNMRSIVPKGYVCHRAEKPIVIDGKLDDESWEYAEWTDYFVDIEGDVKLPPRLRTQAKMLWDDTFFYVGADIQDPHVWATLTAHDAVIFYDNDFEIFIDPNSDNHEYYEIEINAFNTEWDLFLKKPYKDGGPATNDWEIPGLKTAVTVNGTINDPKDNDSGWQVEFAIPWKVLAEYAHKASPPKDGDIWRVNFSRVEYLPEIMLITNLRKDGESTVEKAKDARCENWVWSPQGVINMHCPEKWGYVQFSTAKPGTVSFKPDPTEPARSILHEVYYSQRSFFQRYKRYAKTLDELRLYNLNHESLVSAPEITLTQDGYKVSVTVKLPGGKNQTIHILQDSKIEIE
ncbi:MAG: carbohydrate-binding family 9-like protein [Candidatus Latescibacteria bacterium]|nr:carbohydrate-binding family 9-like protein [Candidatus Latescibacterota bacterium]